ncbi:nitroreductase [Flavobacterium sp. MXW15]|uniref:Putative NAD(P)H nitroreductase n=1 Tax=Xanthomonas chitinilytica TaxID=2989819 RepID=A0ABT3JS80_9XANT|nr:nitroreductase [Xanthomonas sp. H13-6]MCW4454102.1 nitroreductase [Flavobacterium sp. MXW15]MCW4471336.1 nitroreductase [Xanthomonas sp. H13-6]
MPTPYSLQALDQRRSVPALQLGEPAPDDATLLRMLGSAVRVPDHGKLVPFRFLRLRGDARHALGEFLARRSRERDPQAAEAAVEKDRQRFSHAPLIIAVVARLQPGHKVPEQEQLLTAGCVCFALLQAAQAHGFGAQWLTAWMAYDPEVARHLGLGEHERVAGFIHIGTPLAEAPERPRPDPAALLQDWVGERA